MPISELPTIRVRRPLLPLMAVGLMVLASPAGAQRRDFLVELSAAAAYTSYADVTDLDPGPGGVGRLGVWLPANLGLEVEAGFGTPKTGFSGASVDVISVGASLLYNFRIGEAGSAYLRAGAGSVTYGSTCPTVSVPGAGPCGSTGAFLGAGGFRAALTPVLMVRGELLYQRNSNPEPFANLGVNLGLSMMLGSRALTDEDADGVYDKRDRCLATPPGAIIDQAGCPSDTDLDGVLDGLDRCPVTPRGATINDAGCPSDADRDGIVDGVDRCEASPAGAQVDTTGCSSDSDGDRVVDGLDRCAETPPGATVDALGCPGDQDGDRVLDGIDRCPDTPAGIPVNAFGCPPSQDSDRDGVVDAVDRCPGTPFGTAVTAIGCPVAPAGADADLPRSAEVPWVLPGTAFASKSASLRSSALAILDTVATVLRIDPGMRVEIVGHAADGASPAANLQLSAARADAIREVLLRKGVRPQQLAARGVGDTEPLTRETTADALVRNRRTEIRIVRQHP
jgi:OmpA family/Outer membrane protein beta-barrel domain/Thrombospondin type 3 repeat